MNYIPTVQGNLLEDSHVFPIENQYAWSILECMNITIYLMGRTVKAVIPGSSRSMDRIVQKLLVFDEREDVYV
jgi:hypothetical protein